MWGVCGVLPLLYLYVVPHVRILRDTQITVRLRVRLEYDVPCAGARRSARRRRCWLLCRAARPARARRAAPTVLLRHSLQSSVDMCLSLLYVCHAPASASGGRDPASREINIYSTRVTETVSSHVGYTRARSVKRGRISQPNQICGASRQSSLARGRGRGPHQGATPTATSCWYHLAPIPPSPCRPPCLRTEDRTDMLAQLQDAHLQTHQARAAHPPGSLQESELPPRCRWHRPCRGGPARDARGAPLTPRWLVPHVVVVCVRPLVLVVQRSRIAVCL